MVKVEEGAKMYAHIRIPNGGGSVSGSGSRSVSPSPPSSPRRSPRYRHGRGSKGGRMQVLPPQTFMQKLTCLLLSLLLRRHGVFLFAPLIYISGMLLYMGTMSFHVPTRQPPGSLYRSPQVFQKLWPAMQSDNTSSNGLLRAWQHPKEDEEWRPCVNQRSSETGLPDSNGYLMIEANGGLNQQRISICNAVAVAGLLNATLVIPKFHLNSVWRDSSKFRDIYDEEYFINTLRNDVRIVRELPDVIMQRFDNNISNIIGLRVKAWSPVSYYLKKVLPKLMETGVIRISPFANRLSFDVAPSVQCLRCLANYEALRFSEPITSLAEKLVDRMIEHSFRSNGKYIAVHLRFEKDMVAFSCCIYDGGEAEKGEMDAARERGWRGKFNRTGRIIRPGAIRMDGKCPLTPLELYKSFTMKYGAFLNYLLWMFHGWLLLQAVSSFLHQAATASSSSKQTVTVGMMLRGMGFDNTTSIYIAAGKIYKAEKYMAPLRQMFPLLQTKETLASPEELTPFKNYSSRLAALDYTVCLHGEVFVTTQGGNFPHFLMGHRRYLYKGHAKTIKPDKRKLALLFDNPKIRWSNFKRHMQAMRHHSDVKGVEIRKANGSIYTFPTPDCMCRAMN